MNDDRNKIKHPVVGTYHGTSVNYVDRKSPRADFHDYCGGDYFITICIKLKKHYFGKISGQSIFLSKIGHYVATCIEEITEHFPYVEIPLYVVMPNHIHAIISVNKHENEDMLPRYRTALSVVIGSFKQSVTMFARRNSIEFAWQSRYHDHIIRDMREGRYISDYIENNVARWEYDCFNTQKERTGW